MIYNTFITNNNPWSKKQIIITLDLLESNAEAKQGVIVIDKELLISNLTSDCWG